MATILVVDDRAINRQFLVTLLTYAGHVVVEASDGVEALAKMRVEQPGLVISDIYMPNMGGFELAAHMKADPEFAAIPLIFYTATYRVRDAAPLAEKLGVTTVLPKPSEPELILKTVAKALGIDDARKPPAPPPALPMPAHTDALRAASGVEEKLSTYLLVIQELNLKMAAAIDHGLELLAEREQLQASADELRTSLATLQTIGLRLAAVVEAGLEMASEREPRALLDLFCRAAQDVISARYVGVGILDAAGESVEMFLSRGFDGEALGQFPARRGALGRLLSERRPIRLAGLSASVEPAGLPPAHPPIESFLGVPIASPGRVYGWLYLAQRLGALEFSDDDERIAATLAAQLALCYENATLYAEVRHQADELRAARERLDHIVASSPTVTYVRRADRSEMTPSWISTNIKSLLGYSAEEALRPGWWLANTHPEDLEPVTADIPRLLREGQAAREYRFRHADGSWRWIHDEQALVNAPRGGPAEVIGSWSDVTERKSLEAQFLQAQKMESVGRLAGGVAHDFNNLLGVIMGYGQLLAKQLPDESKQRRYVSEILDASDRASGLTRQLLAFSRREVVQPRVLDLNAAVAGSEGMLQRLLGEDIEVVSVLAKDLGRVRADPHQIQQILMNLVVNARDAMPSGGRLTIETADARLDSEYVRRHPAVEPGPYVLLAVSDTGHGMTAEVQARIFEPFFTTKEAGKGSGLGLGTVYGIVKQSGGHVWVYSEPGQGTTFKIYLPRVEDDAQLAELPSEAALLPRGSETILLVEDEAALRGVVSEMLESLGYTVLGVTKGTEALAVAERLEPPLHLLITDVVLPGMGGRELGELITAARPGIKILYVSGYTDDAVLRYGVKAREMAFLQKPFTSGMLARKVREVLDPPTGEAG
jgi:PAS domain S-box-containing protein